MKLEVQAVSTDQTLLRILHFPCFGLAIVMSSMCAADDDDALSDFVKSTFVRCAFYRHYDTDPQTGDSLLVEGEGDALMYFEDIDINYGRARAIYTRIAGQRSVTVIQTSKALHFIDNVSGMYVMTTIYSCLDNNEDSKCVSYGAVNSILSDPTVLTEPNSVLEKIRTVADLGFCDCGFFIGVQEAAHHPR